MSYLGIHAHFFWYRRESFTEPYNYETKDTGAKWSLRSNYKYPLQDIPPGPAPADTSSLRPAVICHVILVTHSLSAQFSLSPDHLNISLASE